jgi:hypothetical protein
METLTFMNYLLTLCCEILLNQKKKEICRSTDVVFTDVLQLKHFFMAIKHFQNVFLLMQYSGKTSIYSWKHSFDTALYGKVCKVLTGHNDYCDHLPTQTLVVQKLYKTFLQFLNEILNP